MWQVPTNTGLGLSSWQRKCSVSSLICHLSLRLLEGATPMGRVPALLPPALQSPKEEAHKSLTILVRCVGAPLSVQAPLEGIPLVDTHSHR